MPVQRHSVVIPREDGGVEVYPLKEWLRQHPEEIPAGLNPNSSNSHQLRSCLSRMTVFADGNHRSVSVGRTTQRGGSFGSSGNLNAAWTLRGSRCG
jgi:hypothetical protein